MGEANDYIVIFALLSPPPTPLFWIEMRLPCSLCTDFVSVLFLAPEAVILA